MSKPKSHEAPTAIWMSGDAFWFTFYALSTLPLIYVGTLSAALMGRDFRHQPFIPWGLVLLFGLLILALVVRVITLRRWTRPSSKYFRYATLFDVWTFRYDQAVAITWIPAGMGYPGLPRWCHRLDLEFETELGREHLWLSIAGNKQPAELELFCERLVEAIRRRTLAGHPLEGEGWSWDARGFHWWGSVYAPSRLVGRQVDEQYLRIYCDAEWHPFATIDLRSKNARVLARLVPSVSAIESSHPLGRLLFTFPTSAPVLHAVMCVIGSLALMLLWLAWRLSLGSLVLPGLFLLALSVLPSVLALIIEEHRLNVHEYGLNQTILHKSLSFGELVSMRWIFGGFLEFQPDPTAGSVPLRACIERGFVPNWPVLRFIAQAIARRWAARLLAGECVEWTPRLRFHPEGLELRTTPFWGMPQSVFVPYGNLQIQQIGSIVLFYRSDQHTPLLRESATVDPFFVGLTLLEQLMQLPLLELEAVNQHWQACVKVLDARFLRAPLPEDPAP